MRYALLLNYRETRPGEIDPEVWAETERAFVAYAAALHDAGVLLAAEILQSVDNTTTVSVRNGSTRIRSQPFADAGDADDSDAAAAETLAGVFLVEVPDLDAAIAWAEECPSAQFGTIQVRPSAMSVIDGRWTH